jgi:ATP-dependent helicase HrpA
VILQMAALDLGDIDSFPWLDPPEHRHVAEGYRILQTLGALDDERALTRLGRELARLPLDPRIARIAIAGRGTVCTDEVMVLASALSVQDPHDVPPDAQDEARAMHAQWRHPKSDFISLLNLWARWRAWSDESSNRQLRRVCREHFVSYLRMEEWESVYKQIADMTDGERKPPAKRAGIDELYAPIHKALLAGLIDHVGVKVPEKPEFQGPRGRRFRIFPGSTLAKKPPPWVMSAALAQTSQLFARTNAMVEPEWLAEVGAHLVRRVLHDPQWNAVRGEVTATEHVSLLGLPLLKRTRHYGSEEPREARAIFIREALVRGDWQHKPEFLRANLALIEDIREKETRLRRPDLLADESQLFAFYDARLPADVCTAAGLKAWFRRGAADAALDPHPSALSMTAQDALRPGASLDVEHLYPDHLVISGVQLALEYTHDPGADTDGVTFHVPLAQLFRLDPRAFDWLVPGLLPARIEALIRTLPHALRRRCSPAGEYAIAIANSLAFGDGDLLAAICARFRSMTGVELQPQDFAPDEVDAWLAPRLLLEDESGAAVGEARSLAQLQARHAGGAREALNRSAQVDAQAARWTRADLGDWDFGDLPDALALVSGATVHPALDARDASVDLRLFESADAAQAAHRAGVPALLLARMPERLRDLAKRARSQVALAALKLDPEDVARAIGERVADELWTGASIRSAQAFQQALEQRARFSTHSLARLDELAGWLAQAAELRRGLPGVAQWRESHADIREQIDTLFAPGFLRAIPPERWERVGVYLRAVKLRIERLPNKPQRDAELTAQVRKLLARLPGPFHPARWVIEEWRVALFAQELKAQGAPTAQKVEAAL